MAYKRRFKNAKIVRYKTIVQGLATYSNNKTAKQSVTNLTHRGHAAEANKRTMRLIGLPDAKTWALVKTAPNITKAIWASTKSAGAQIAFISSLFLSHTNYATHPTPPPSTPSHKILANPTHISCVRLLTFPSKNLIPKTVRGHVIAPTSHKNCVTKNTF